MKTEKSKQNRAGGGDYTLIRSGRRTVSIEVRAGGGVVVRAPERLSAAEIRAFVESRGRVDRAGESQNGRRVRLRNAMTKRRFSGADGESLPYLGGTLTLARREGVREPRIEAGNAGYAGRRGD